MKLKTNPIIHILLSILFLSLSVGCQKAPINGDLDGQWQVMSVEPEPTEIILKDRLYMCFYLHTCQLTEYGTGAYAVGNMVYSEGKTLYMYFPYAQSSLSVARLKQYGIYRNPVTFTIEHLDKKSMVLRDGDVVVTLRKF